MNEELLCNQYVVSYKKNNKWYRDSERHQNIKNVTKRLEELKKKTKYDEYKIFYRKISLWKELEKSDK